MQLLGALRICRWINFVRKDVSGVSPDDGEIQTSEQLGQGFTFSAFQICRDVPREQLLDAFDRMIRDARSVDNFWDRFRSTRPYRAVCRSPRHSLHRQENPQKKILSAQNHDRNARLSEYRARVPESFLNSSSSYNAFTWPDCPYRSCGPVVSD